MVVAMMATKYIASRKPICTVLPDASWPGIISMPNTDSAYTRIIRISGVRIRRIVSQTMSLTGLSLMRSGTVMPDEN